MPCYSPTNVDQQRGHGVFDRSIKGLQMLNAVGYGQEGTGLQLDLVYNPNGIFLAPAQDKLQVCPCCGCCIAGLQWTKMHYSRDLRSTATCCCAARRLMTYVVQFCQESAVNRDTARTCCNALPAVVERAGS